MNFCLSVFAITIIGGMTVLLVAWRRSLHQRFRATIDTWAAAHHVTVHTLRYVFPLMSLNAFVWQHPHDAIFKLSLHDPRTGTTVERWLALGCDSFGAPNGTITEGV